MNTSTPKFLSLCVIIAALAIGMSSCKKKNDPGLTGNYFSAQLDGVSVNSTNAINAVTIQDNRGGSGQTGDFVVAGGTWVTTNYSPIGEVLMANYIPDYAPTPEEYYTLYAQGSYKYATSAYDSGAMVHVADTSGTYWQSELGDNTGSTFKITSRGAINTTTGYATFSGTFNCKVYDGNGHNKTATGSFVSYAPLSD